MSFLKGRAGRFCDAPLRQSCPWIFSSNSVLVVSSRWSEQTLRGSSVCADFESVILHIAPENLQSEFFSAGRIMAEHDRCSLKEQCVKFSFLAFKEKQNLHETTNRTTGITLMPVYSQHCVNKQPTAPLDANNGIAC